MHELGAGQRPVREAPLDVGDVELLEVEHGRDQGVVSGPAKPANGPQPVGSKRGPGTQRQLAGLTSDGGAPVLGRLLVRVGVARASLASEKRRPTNAMLAGRPVSAGKPAGTLTIG